MPKKKKTTKPKGTGAPVAASSAKPRSKRFRWIALAVVLAGAAAGVWFWTRGSTGPHAFVLISIDTLRADRLPVYGYGNGRTPALDAFARDGVVFERAYAHAPQTLPSHASMFTGLLPFEHKVRDNLGFGLGSDQATMASLFGRAGYRTAGFASAYVLRTETGIAQGFSVYDAALPASAVDRTPGEILRPGPATLAATTAWLKTQADDRFFLFFHIYEPHTPYTPPARFTQPDKYDGEVAYADEIVGQLLDALRQRAWYDGATIVVTADHGEGLGDHTEREHGLFVYDETIRVPLMIKQSRARHGGRRVSEPVQHIDLLPTLASLGGFAAPAGLRGRDLQPLLTGLGGIAPQGIYAEALYPRYHFGWSELVALVDGRYKYIKAPTPELYDLDLDARERQNLAADRAQVASAMRSGLESTVGGRAIDAPSAVSAEDRERLAALGYVGTKSTLPAATPGESLPDPKDKVHVLVKYREAIDLIGTRQLDEGVVRLREVLRDSPDMFDGWIHLAGTYIRMGRLQDAYAAYREAIRRKPDESGALLGASSTLSAMGRFEEARQHAELAVSVSPAAAHQALATIALQQKRFDEALRQGDLAAAADPTLPVPLVVRGMIEHGQGRYAEALPYLMKARDAYARRTMQANDLNFYIGDSLARLERYKEAEPFFLQELRLYPQSVQARSGLAMLYQSMERPADADRMLQDMLRVSANPQAYERAEAIYRMFGHPDRADAVRIEAQRKFGSARNR
jgi:arylsulfatase A-like enzyme/Tfp pilus assembly protein PilF